MYCWVYWFFRDGIFTTWVYLIFMVHHIALHELADVLGYCSKPTLGVTLGLNSGSKIPLARGCRISPMHIMGYFQRLGTFLGMTQHQSTKRFKYFLGMDIFEGYGS